jgi:adenylate cyclase
MNSRLVAIAFADVADYTVHLQQNTRATAAAWQRIRIELVAPQIGAHGGRLIDRAGDGLLVEFASALEAVSWALDVQDAVAGSHPAKGEPRLALRIGINVEDALFDEEGKPVGEGVNVAARVHALGQPGEVLVTDMVRRYVAAKLPLRFYGQGEQQLKNVARPVRVHRVERDPTGRIDQRDYPVVPARTVWPSIAVLPFVDLGGDGAGQYFGEGITEDIIGALGCTRSVFVVARTATLRFADRLARAGEAQSQRAAIASELGVRYLLDGTVQRQAGELLIRAELADVETGRSLWTNRLQGSAERLFEFQAGISRSIVGAIEPQLLKVEAERASARPAGRLAAYECVLRGMSLLYRFDDQGFDEAGRLFQRATELDPAYARSHAYLAWWHNFRLGEERSDERSADTGLAEQAAERAIELDPLDPFSLAVAGHIKAFLRRDSDVAVDLFNRALEQNPCSAFAWAISAPTYTYRGRPDIAIERIQTAQDLSPKDPMSFKYRTSEGIAWFVAGDYAKAIRLLKLARIDNRRYNACNRVLAAALALNGQQDEAAAVGSEYLRLHPLFTVARLEQWYPLQPADMARLADGLRRAGLPG